MSATFRNDYSDLGAKEVLEALWKAEGEKNVGYGYDVHSLRAEALIRELFGTPDGAVYFLSGGTQSNMVVISYLLRAYECVLSVTEGHINAHETGAVESTGHKILTVAGDDGKLRAADIEKAFESTQYDWSQKLKVVYITQATEGGTVYRLSELEAIRKMCDKYGLYLFVDGARLASALTSEGNDVSPADIGRLADVFYVGGTKNGALFGEAVVFRNAALSKNFRAFMKNRGALNAKGYVLGIQFEALFTDGLWFRLARHANEMAEYIREALSKKGVVFEGSGRTNQLFTRFPKAVAKKMFDEFGLEYWTEDETTILSRIVTSFKTTKEECDEIIAAISEVSGK